jgi:septal ring factor EnvC (AmiA/AmiB activator)
MDIYGNSEEDKQKAHEIPEIVKTTENITRASQFLESSLMNDVDYDGFPEPPNTISPTEQRSSSEEDMNQYLRSELEAANSKLNAMQASYNKIKDASRNALDEFTRAKEEFAKEVALRQQQEYTILQLKHQLNTAYQSKQMTRPELSVITKEEIERVARIRVELDKTCNELKGYRNVLVKDIESLARQKQTGLEL